MCCQRSHYNKLCPKYYAFPVWYSPEVWDYYSLTDGWHGHWYDREDGNCDSANLRSIGFGKVAILSMKGAS